MASKVAGAIGITGLGLLVLWSGITNAGIVASVQSLARGVAPTPGTPQIPFLKAARVNAGNAAFMTGGTGSGGTTGGVAGGSGNSAIANAALKYQGYRYVWGGSDPNPTSAGGDGGFDCYGLLTYVLHHDLGYNLPNNHHSGYFEFLSWGGAQPVDLSKEQIQAGDLIIWPTHSGIAISGTEMISAENPGAGVKVDTFSGGGPLMPEPMTVLRVGGGSVAYA